MWGAVFMYNTTQLGYQTSGNTSGMLSSLSGPGGFVSRKVILWGFFFPFVTYFNTINCYYRRLHVLCVRACGCHGVHMGFKGQLCAVGFTLPP